MLEDRQVMSHSAELSPAPVSTSDVRSPPTSESDANVTSGPICKHSRRQPPPMWGFCATRPSTTSDNEQDDTPSSHQWLSDDHSLGTGGTRATTPDISLREGLYRSSHRGPPESGMSLEPSNSTPSAPVRLSSGSCNATRSTWSLTSFGTNIFSSSSKSRRGGSSLLTGTALSSIDIKAELTSATTSTPPHSQDTSRSNVKQNSDQPQPGVTAAPVRSTQASPPATCASSHPSPPAGPLLLDQKPHSIGKLLSSILLPKQRGQHKADTADHSTAPSSCTPSIHTSGLPDVQPQSQPSRQQDNIQHCESFYSHPAQVSPQAGDSSAGHVEIQDEHLASAHPQSPVGERDTHSSESDWDALGGGDEQAAGSNVGALDAWQCGPDAWSASVSVSGGSAIQDAKIPASTTGSASRLPKPQDGKPLSDGQISEQILSNRMLEMQRSIKALTREELREGRSFASHRQAQQEQQSQRYLASLNSGSLVDGLYTHAEQQVDTLLWTTDSTILAHSGMGPSFELDPQGKYQGYPSSDTATLQGPEWQSGHTTYCTWPEDVDSEAPSAEGQSARPYNGHSLEHLLSMPLDPTILAKPLTAYKPSARSPSLSILEALYRGSLPTNISAPAFPSLQTSGQAHLDQQIATGTGVGADVAERPDAWVRSEGVGPKVQQALQPKRSSMVPKHANGRWTAPEGPTGLPALPLGSNARSLTSWDSSGLPPTLSRSTAPAGTTSQNGLMSRASPNIGALFFGSHVGAAPPLSQMPQQHEVHRSSAYGRRPRQSSIAEYPRYNLALSKVRDPAGETGETTSRVRSSPQNSGRPPSLYQSGDDVDVSGWGPLMGSVPLGQQQLEQQPWLESTASAGLRQSVSSSYSPILLGREPSEGWDNSLRLATAPSHRTASTAQSDTGSFAPHRQQHRRVGFSNHNNIPESYVAAEQQPLQRSLNHGPSSTPHQDFKSSQQHFGVTEACQPGFHSPLQMQQQQPTSDFLSENLLASGSHHGKQRQYGVLKPLSSVRQTPGPNSHQHLSSSTFSSAPLHTERIVTRSGPALRGLTGVLQPPTTGLGGGRGGTVDGSWREMADYPVTAIGVSSSNEFPGPWPQEQELWRGSSSGAGARAREGAGGLEPGGGAYDSHMRAGRPTQRQGFVGMLDAAAASGRHLQLSGPQGSASTQGLLRRGVARASTSPMTQFQTMMPCGFPSPFLQQNSQMLLDEGCSLGGYGGGGYGAELQQQPPAQSPVAMRHPLDRYMLGGACAVMLLNIALVIYAVMALQAVRLGA